MDVQPVSLNTLLVQCRELHRQMAEVLDLRAKVASVEKSGSMARQRRGKASDSRAIEQRA
jgi:hypothetical protein